MDLGGIGQHIGVTLDRGADFDRRGQCGPEHFQCFLDQGRQADRRGLGLGLAAEGQNLAHQIFRARTCPQNLVQIAFQFGALGHLLASQFGVTEDGREDVVEIGAMPPARCRRLRFSGFESGALPFGPAGSGRAVRRLAPGVPHNQSDAGAPREETPCRPCAFQGSIRQIFIGIDSCANFLAHRRGGCQGDDVLMVHLVCRVSEHGQNWSLNCRLSRDRGSGCLPRKHRPVV